MANVWGFFHDSFTTLEHIFLFSTFIIIFDLKKKQSEWMWMIKTMTATEKFSLSVGIFPLLLALPSRDGRKWVFLSLFHEETRQAAVEEEKIRNLREKVDSESPKQAVHSRWVDVAWNNLCVYLEGQKKKKSERSESLKSAAQHNIMKTSKLKLWNGRRRWDYFVDIMKSEKSEGERRMEGKRSRSFSTLRVNENFFISFLCRLLKKLFASLLRSMLV